MSDDLASTVHIFRCSDSSMSEEHPVDLYIYLSRFSWWSSTCITRSVFLWEYSTCLSWGHCSCRDTQPESPGIILPKGALNLHDQNDIRAAMTWEITMTSNHISATTSVNNAFAVSLYSKVYFSNHAFCCVSLCMYRTDLVHGVECDVLRFIVTELFLNWNRSVCLICKSWRSVYVAPSFIHSSFFFYFMCPCFFYFLSSVANVVWLLIPL